MPDNDDINWDNILSKDNHTIEELNREEIAILEEWARQESERDLYMQEFPDANINPYL